MLQSFKYYRLNYSDWYIKACYFETYLTVLSFVSSHFFHFFLHFLSFVTEMEYWNGKDIWGISLHDRLNWQNLMRKFWRNAHRQIETNEWRAKNSEISICNALWELVSDESFKSSATWCEPRSLKQGWRFAFKVMVASTHYSGNYGEKGFGGR